MNEKIKNKIGNSFPTPLIIVGVIAIIGSVLIILTNPILAIILLLVGLFLCTSSYGTEIDVTNKKYREYGSIYGLKSGSWFDLNTMPYLAILKSRSGYTMYSRSNRSTTNINDFYDVCLLNQSHRKKVVLMKFKSIEAALKVAGNLESQLGVELTQFNPVISEKTANRRR
jgi:hypothetical protein